MPVPTNRWTDETIRIIILSNEKEVEKKVRAQVRQGIAVHNDHQGRPLSAVTLVATGVRACQVKTRDDALMIAELLIATFGEKIFWTDYERLKDWTIENEPWCRKWLMKCQALGRYIEPVIE